MGEKAGSPQNLKTIFIQTCMKSNKLVEPEAQIKEIVKAEPSLSSLEIVEKCYGPQNRSPVFYFGGEVKARDVKWGTSSKSHILHTTSPV
ncbi:hypothetical protein KY290_034994 [Solanum tuberosum]|uniref:Uncharacterized protein n=1 Tax=Solanum tuberosum TaxID=4113 RepID=A0ABQ7U578_SOLTU|nr:hypothetical protein KY284_024784 [Solanum tuberosum]KAH0720207.1 hypothetical protein KY284_005237 [Solanum tuberosum]KAH0741951.1 hypothetical protein KY290_034994 [Solanum tuberosum]